MPGFQADSGHKPIQEYPLYRVRDMRVINAELPAG